MSTIATVPIDGFSRAVGANRKGDVQYGNRRRHAAGQTCSVVEQTARGGGKFL